MIVTLFSSRIDVFKNITLFLYKLINRQIIIMITQFTKTSCITVAVTYISIK